MNSFVSVTRVLIFLPLRLIMAVLNWAFAEDGPRLFSRPYCAGTETYPIELQDSETVSPNNNLASRSFADWFRDQRASDPGFEVTDLGLVRWNICQDRVTADQSDYQGPAPYGDI